MSVWWYVRMQLCMTVNGVEQVRIAMLALPGALEFDKIPPGGDTSPHVIVKTTDERVCRSLGLVADHIADKVLTDNNHANSYDMI